MQRRVPWLFLVAFAATARSASPADIAEYLARLAVMDPKMEKKGLSVPTECTEPEAEKFWRVLAGIHAEEEYGHRLRGKASLGFLGDNARPYGGLAGSSVSAGQPEADQYKVTAGLKLNRGTYPGEFKFDAEVDVRLQGGSFEQNVRDLFVAYDHWLASWSEAYVFASQYSDSYMEIDQRYEVGAGVFLGPHFGARVKRGEPVSLLASDLPSRESEKKRCRSRPAKDEAAPGKDKCREDRDEKRCTGDLVERWKSELESVRECWRLTSDGKLDLTTCGVPPWLACYARVMKDPSLAMKDLEALFDDLGDQWLDAQNAQKQGSAMFRVGVALSVFAELENAGLKYTPIAAAGESATTPQTALDVPLPATQRYRWAIRPTFECWPSRRWAFRGDWYFKLPLGDARTTVPGEAASRYDYRYDLDVTGEFTVNEKEIGQPGNVTVGLRYRRLFDNVPPFYQPTAASTTPFLIAPDTHTRISMDFNIRW